jgi:expansin (peptidoglycan-binding protein)
VGVSLKSTYLKLTLGKDSNTYNKDLCGTNVEIVNLNNNKSVVVSIQDNCPTCVNAESIDLSVGAFLHLDVLATGQIPIKWKYV